MRWLMRLLGKASTEALDALEERAEQRSAGAEKAQKAVGDTTQLYWEMRRAESMGRRGDRHDRSARS